MNGPRAGASPLRLLSIVIPARDEEGCICSTVEHLHVELRLQKIPHEIIVVDDGSQDRTWELLEGLAGGLCELKPVRNPSPHGFGRAIVAGLREMTGDAVVIMMADESDDCRDVARYWQKLNEGYDCVFGSRFMKGGGVIDYPIVKLVVNRLANTVPSGALRHAVERHDECIQGLPPRGDRGLPAARRSALQPDRRTAAEGHRARLQLDDDPDHLAEQADGRREAEDEGDGQPVPFYLPLCMVGETPLPWRLSETLTCHLHERCGNAGGC